jgi:hypothetical protein
MFAASLLNKGVKARKRGTFGTFTDELIALRKWPVTGGVREKFNNEIFVNINIVDRILFTS